VQARDAGRAAAVDGCQELQGGKAAVGHDDQLAAGQPAAGLQHDLPPPVGQHLMLPPARLAAALQGGQEL